VSFMLRKIENLLGIILSGRGEKLVVNLSENELFLALAELWNVVLEFASRIIKRARDRCPG
jgi:hypothetical protein